MGRKGPVCCPVGVHRHHPLGEGQRVGLGGCGVGPGNAESNANVLPRVPEVTPWSQLGGSEVLVVSWPRSPHCSLCPCFKDQHWEQGPCPQVRHLVAEGPKRPCVGPRGGASPGPRVELASLAAPLVGGVLGVSVPVPAAHCCHPWGGAFDVPGWQAGVAQQLSLVL